ARRSLPDLSEMSLEDKLYPLLSVYERLPHPLKAGIGSAYRILPQRIRRGRHFREFQQLVEAGESWGSRAIREYQTAQLRKTLHHANAYCSFYQRRFAESGFRPEQVRELEDLEGCPTITKQDLIDHREEMASTRSEERRVGKEGRYRGCRDQCE